MIKNFVDWHVKIDTMQDRTFKFCTCSYKAILHIMANYHLKYINGNKDIEYLVVHVLVTRRNLKLCSETLFKSYFKILTTITILSKLKFFFTYMIIRHIHDFTRNFPENVQNLSV